MVLASLRAQKLTGPHIVAVDTLNLNLDKGPFDVDLKLPALNGQETVRAGMFDESPRRSAREMSS